MTDGSSEQFIQFEAVAKQELPKPTVYQDFQTYLAQRFPDRQTLPAAELNQIATLLSSIGYDSFLPVGGILTTIEGFSVNSRPLVLITTPSQNGLEATYSLVDLNDIKDTQAQGEIGVAGVVVQNKEGQCTDLLEILPPTTQTAFTTNDFVARIQNLEKHDSTTNRPTRKITVPPIATNRPSPAAMVFNDFVNRHKDIFQSGVRYWDIDKIPFLHEAAHDLLNNVGFRRMIREQVDENTVIELPQSNTEVERETNKYALRLYFMYKQLGFNLAPKLNDTQVEQIQNEFVASYEKGAEEDIKKYLGINLPNTEDRLV